MPPRTALTVRYLPRAWLVLLVPVVGVVDAVVEAVAADPSGVTDFASGVLHVLGKVFLAVIVWLTALRVLRRDVLAADAEGLACQTWLIDLMELPWAAVREIRVERTRLGGRVVVVLAGADAPFRLVTARGTTSPVEDWLERRYRRRGYLTVPLLATTPKADEVAGALVELAAGRCPVTRPGKK